MYFTAGDAAAARAARAAGILVGTVRALATLAEAKVELDALVSSSSDAGERYEPGDLERPPRLVVRTAGSSGGAFETADGRHGTWDATPPPGPPRDAYGCGDSFAAGLTYGLGAGKSPEDALELAAPMRCGLPERPRPLRGPAARRRLRPHRVRSAQATRPSAGSIGSPLSTHASRPPAML